MVKASLCKDKASGGVICLYLPQDICAVKVFLSSLSIVEDEDRGMRKGVSCIIEHSKENETPCQKSLAANR